MCRNLRPSGTHMIDCFVSGFWPVPSLNPQWVRIYGVPLSQRSVLRQLRSALKVVC